MKELPGVAQRVEQGAVEIELLCPGNEVFPKTGPGAEVSQQVVHVGQVAETAGQVSVLKQVGGTVQDHVGRGQHLYWRQATARPG